MHDDYLRQSAATEPGELDFALGPVRADVRANAELVRGLIVPLEVVEKAGLAISADRIQEEVTTGDVGGMLAALLALDDRTPLRPREPLERIVGICNHHAILLCCLLRRAGLPARVRSGFETYYHPERHHDHTLCEYWDAGRAAWVRVDAEADPVVARERFGMDVCDVGDEEFLTGAQAWLECRAGRRDPETFGVMGDEWEGGWEFLLSALLCDLRGLLRDERLPWSDFLLTEREDGTLSDEELAALDRAAGLIAAGDASHAEFVRFCAGNGFFE